jgi:hypothetical protein
MAKAPRIGAGKTRLAREIGSVEAWRVNRALQAYTLKVARGASWRTVLCVSPDRAVGIALPGIWPREINRIAQGRGDLGKRLACALSPYRNVAVIGTDCPTLKRAHIAAAFAALRRTPFALGPTHDGGFWLFAARSGAQAARAMNGVRWSSAHAAGDVLRNLGAANVVILPLLHDVDTAADLAIVRAQRSALRPSSDV